MWCRRRERPAIRWRGAWKFGERRDTSVHRDLAWCDRARGAPAREPRIGAEKARGPKVLADAGHPATLGALRRSGARLSRAAGMRRLDSVGLEGERLRCVEEF